jgi:hypothetical protein
MACTQTGLKLEDFEGSRFKRVDQIKQLMSSDLFVSAWPGEMAKKNGRGWVQLHEYVSPEDIFSEYAYFFVLLGQLGSAHGQIRRHDRGAAGSRREELRGGSRKQRRLPTSILRREEDPGPGHRTGCQYRQSRRRERRADARGILRREARGVSQAKASRRISSRAQTSWRKCRTSTTSSRASRYC